MPIHPTAIIDPRAELHPSVEIGPYVIIDGPAVLAAGVRVLGHAQILGRVEIGEECVIGQGAVVGGAPQDLHFDPSTESSVVMGPRNVLREHVTIHRGSKPGSATRLGEGNFLMVGAHLAHDVVLGDRNILANACLLAGHIVVGNGTFIGGGAVFHQFLRIGDGCVIQGNGSFGKDIPHFCAAMRTNRLTGLNVVGLRRAGVDAAARSALRSAFKQLFCSGLNLSDALRQARLQPPACEPVARLLDFVAQPSKRGICPWRGGAQTED
jgi:UDP-N-acetylglucosamine acyltransferase